MDRHDKIKLAAAAVAALLVAVALGATAAVGAPRVLSSSDDGQTVIDDAAAELGVEPSALEGALRTALKNRVDDAVEAGILTEEGGCGAEGAGRFRPDAAPLRRLRPLSRL